MEQLLTDDVRRRILAEITPTRKELDLQNTVIQTLIDALANHTGSQQFSYSFIEAQGSTGKKQTQLRGAADIDLFVGLIPDEYGNILEQPLPKRHKAIDDLMNWMIKNWFEPAVDRLNVVNVQRAFSQHPFLSLRMNGLEIDILGCFDISADHLSREGPYTAVDRTVHHTRYIAEAITRVKREDARILKSFVRASHAYGDQCAVGRMGITGVSLEILSIISDDLTHAFENLELLIDRPIDPQYRPVKTLRNNSTFKDDYIILIDPTDHKRNIASSFTPRAYEWVRHRICNLRDATNLNDIDEVLNIILESPIPTTDIPRWLARHAFVFEFRSDGTRHYTILRDKLYRIARKIEIALQSERTGEVRFGDTLSEVYFEDNRYSVGFLVETPEISDHYVRRGPPVALVDACVEFRNNHQEVVERDGFLWTTERRAWVNPKSLIDQVLEDSPVMGLVPIEKPSEVSKKVLNVLYRYILPIEQAFSEKMTRVKDRDPDNPR
ncbi:MAG: hypothetical protein ACFFE2_07790 [Candidatus Thorarchaeota archaeon]